MKELKLRSHVTIKTQITEWEGKINKLRQWIENEKGQNCCEAEFTFSLFDTKARKIIAPTPEWLKALGIN
jgi:acyl-CoA thioester hydrolase